MCGLYRLVTSPEQVCARFGCEGAEPFPPRPLIRPGEPVGIVRREDDGARHWRWVVWGLVPHWMKEPFLDENSPVGEFSNRPPPRAPAQPPDSMHGQGAWAGARGGSSLLRPRWKGRRIINARAETLLERPAFRGAVRHRRCLVPADGFYEWTGPRGRKRAVLFTLPDERPFAMAGLWERWMGANGGEIETMAIVTVDANADVAPVHERMPALLRREHWRAWLDVRAVPAQEAIRLLAPAPDGTLRAHEAGDSRSLFAARDSSWSVVHRKPQAGDSRP